MGSSMSSTPNELRQTPGKVESPSCNAYGQYPNMLCNLEDKKGCYGDSGSGLIFTECGRKFILGTVSGGPIDASKRCEVGKPSWYANVHAHMDWIKKTWEALAPGTFKEPQGCDAKPDATPDPNPTP